ncbi:MAG: ribonuclease HI family protein [bacterium]|nr:ribonuclease HI family protein [bacterium]
MNTLFDDKRLVIYTDGGARGNPGPAAIGVVVGSKKYGEYIGEATNNVAEYKAVIFALKKAKALIGKKKAADVELEVNMDSELVVRQLNGDYKILDENLQPLFVEVWNLRLDFGGIIFRHVPREKNKEADGLVNEALDNQ